MWSNDSNDPGVGDEVDRANDHAERERSRAEAMTRHAAAAMPAGVQGDCDFCGEWSGRLVGGACAPCRDARRLP